MILKNWNNRLTVLTCLAVTVLYVPVFLSPAHSARYIFLSGIVPLMVFSAQIKWRREFVLPVIFMAWSTLTFFWAISSFDFINRIWWFALFFGVMLAATKLTSQYFKWCLLALFFGVLVNLAASVFDIAYPGVILTNDRNPGSLVNWKGAAAGLQTNPNYFAHISVLTGVGLMGFSQMRYKVMAGVSLIIGLAPLSSAAIVAAGAVAVVSITENLTIRIRMLVTAIVVSGVVAVSGYAVHHPSISVRVPLYMNSANMIDLKGKGAGSFWSAYPEYQDSVISTSDWVYDVSTRPRTAHNDFITMAAEVGLIGLFLYLFFLSRLLKKAYKKHRLKPAFNMAVAFLTIGVFSFPFYVPAQMFIGALAFGFLLNDTQDNISGGGS